MAYTKINWQDVPSTSTPINAANLNHMDDGIASATSLAESVNDDVADIEESLEYKRREGKEFSFASIDGGIVVDSMYGMLSQNNITTPNAPAEILSVGSDDNLISYPYYSGAAGYAGYYGIGDKIEVNGGTFEVLPDWSVRANGTFTARSEFGLAYRLVNGIKLANGKYTLSGCPAGGSSSTYFMYGTYNKPNSTAYGGQIFANDYGEGVVGTVDTSVNGDIGIQIAIAAGYTANNLIFKPMLTRGTTVPKHYKAKGEGLSITTLNRNLATLPYADGNGVVGGITRSVGADGKITINGESTTTTFYNVINSRVIGRIATEQGKTYTVTLNKIQDDNVSIIYRTYDSSKTRVKDYIVGAPTTKGTYTYTFTRDNNDNEVYDCLYLSIPVGTYANNSYYVQLEEGVASSAYTIPQSEEATTDIVLRAIPVTSNDDWNYREEVHYKNIVKYPYYQTTKTSYRGMDFTDNGDGSITISGEATADAGFYFEGAYSNATATQWLEAGTYLFKAPIGGAANKYAFQNRLYDEDGTFITVFVNDTDVTYTLNKPRRLSNRLYIWSGQSFSNFVFTPEIIKISGYDYYVADRLYYENGYKIERRVGHEVINSTTGSYNTTYNYCLIDNAWARDRNIKLSGDYNRLANAITTHFKQATRNGTLGTDLRQISRFSLAYDTYQMTICNPALNTTQQYKDWLAANPFEIQYELATPVIEEISEKSAKALAGLKSWDYTTKLLQNNEVKGGLTIKYGTTPSLAKAIEGTNNADYEVIEAGAYTIRKYKSGRMQMVFSKTYTVDITQTSGALFFGTIQLDKFPINFKKPPVATITAYGSTAQSNNAFVWGQEPPTVESVGTLWVGRGTSVQNALITIQMIVEGEV